MRLALPSLVLFVLPLACSFDSSGQPEAGSGANDEADVTTGTPESGGESGTDQGTSTTADTDTEGPGTTESTTDPTTESTTESTTDPTTESTTESTTDPTTESTTDTTETTETTGEDSPPYGTCDSCAIGEICKDSGIEFVLDPWEVCGTPCNDTNDCPDAGGNPLICLSYNLQQKACFIECGNSQCPPGMTCVGVNLGGADICVWQ